MCPSFSGDTHAPNSKTSLDGQTAETVLKRLVSWYETNKATWEAKRQAVRSARKALRLAVRRLNVGLPGGAERPDIPQLPFDELRTRKAALAAASGAEAELLAACRANVETLLTDSQKGLWSTIRGNPAAASCLPLALSNLSAFPGLPRTKAGGLLLSTGYGLPATGY